MPVALFANQFIKAKVSCSIESYIFINYINYIRINKGKLENAFLGTKIPCT